METFHYEQPPLFCTICGSRLVEIRFEKRGIGFDCMTGEKLPAEFFLRRSCPRDPEAFYHSVYHRFSVKGALGNYWAGA
jgi:hypothetical protein